MVFVVRRDTTEKVEVIEGDSVFMYDTNSFIDILDHLKKETNFKVHISERRSRIVEIVAATWDEAVEKAKKLMETEPLNSEDSDGIDFY